ncbi:sensor histidine kinase [Saccharibacillus sp. CPCC 101409]|uniref:cache domain-containing sensor histidine kinase n=1 Tax=Saccharibacillus sp. CPCC 101409 TaxID=3058041 RepID=UPI002674045D|nr:sensor histidine kinase [Saccharibacillus sp. CPCC 101409]MDO3413257.1 sensor histidine kinase [Saccharibacillus sp. CPCC 101409]
MPRYRKLLPKSIFAKFSTSFILVGLVPLFALSLFSVQTFSNYVTRYTTGNLEQMILYMSYNLNSAFGQYDDISKLMYTGRYEGFSDSMRRNQMYNVNELEQINATPIDSFLKTVLYSDPYLTAAYFVRESDGRVYYQERENRGLRSDELPVRSWKTAMQKEPAKLAVFPSHADPYFVGAQRSVFTVARNLIDTSGPLTREPKIAGTLFFDVDTSLFRQFLGELSLGGEDELVLVDGSDRLFFSRQGGEDAVRRLIEGSDRDLLLLQEEVPVVGGRLIAGVHRTALFEQLFSARTTVYLAILICSLALIVMGAWFSRRLSSPIRRLTRQMTVVESGKLDKMPPVDSEDEIGRLTQGFNRMVERLQAHIDEAYVAQIKQKQTELNALKSQIRPHYLYNTLEVIRMNAVDKEAGEVADMIHSLANQLKYVIDFGEDRVGLATEIEHLRNYFYIISVRYDNRYTLRVDLAPDVRPEWPVLKLSLQPIVENAIQHGLRGLKKGTIGVSAERRGGVLSIAIDDDGTGMSAETLERIERALDEDNVPGKSVGLKNVHERIRSVYGEEYGLSVSSREGMGTSVRLRFPIPEFE